MKKISPDRIVNAVKESFKGILSKPLLKNLILVTIAIAMSEKLKINEISRKLPVDVIRFVVSNGTLSELKEL